MPSRRDDTGNKKHWLNPLKGASAVAHSRLLAIPRVTVPRAVGDVDAAKAA